MPRKPRHNNTHLPRLQPLASALLAICIGAPSAQAVANTAVDLGLNQRHTTKAARSTPQTNQRQHRSAPHLGGWSIGVLTGINWLDTGQAGNVASRDTGTNVDLFSYHHYRHGIWGLTTGYELPATRSLLWGVELAYKELGSAKMDVRDNAGAKDHYDTDSVKASSLLFSARYYLQDHFSVVAKLGGALQRSRFSHRVTGVQGPLSGSTNGFTAREVRTALNPEWQLGLSQDWGAWRASVLLDRITGQAPELTGLTAPVTNPNSMAGLLVLSYRFTTSQ